MQGILDIIPNNLKLVLICVAEIYIEVLHFMHILVCVVLSMTPAIPKLKEGFSKTHSDICLLVNKKIFVYRAEQTIYIEFNKTIYW